MIQRAGRERSRKGQVIVEAALTLLLFLMGMIGVIEFSRAVWMYNLVAHLAREGTRYGIVRGGSTPSPATASDIRAAVLRHAVGLNPALLAATVSWVDSGGGPATNKPGNYVRVRVEYSFNFITPFLPANALTLRSTSQLMILN